MMPKLSISHLVGLIAGIPILAILATNTTNDTIFGASLGALFLFCIYKIFHFGLINCIFQLSNYLKIGCIFLATSFLLTGLATGNLLSELARAAVVITLCLGISTLKQKDKLDFFQGLTIIGIISLTGPLFFTNAAWNGRPSIGNIHHNLFGLSCASVAWATALCQPKSKKYRIFCLLGCTLATILTMTVESRSGFILSILSIPASYLPRNGAKLGKSSIKFIALILILTIPTIIFKEGLISIFKLDDKYRGLDSGGSGRIQLASDASTHLTDTIIAGVGSGNAQTHLQQPLDNAYLSAWIELGILAFIGYILILAFGLYREIRYSVITPTLMFLISYTLYGLLEGRYISLGNPITPVFFIVAFSKSHIRIN